MEPTKKYLKDYLPPDYEVPSTWLSFSLSPQRTLVKQKTQYVKKNLKTAKLVLDGVGLKLNDVKLNGHPCKFEVSESLLTIFDTPNEFTLEIENCISPQENLSLEGLYFIKNLYSTQCEPEAFRKITYFLDRPDVMTTYTVEIESSLPVRLSNGNCIFQDEKRVIWQDPHPKPSYLFALVAGDLGVLKDQFKTRSGRVVDLEIYSPHGTQELCQFAMTSLKKSMKWDEDRFDREYDLDRYMILAVDHFNAGAMENKGLNIFNSRLVFADPKIASDADFMSVESVIAHEYFHNWTGNRVTLRDWFHLSLKEGLTVFRDQEFTMDLHSRAVARIEDVRRLKQSQFIEDAGPNRHPVRPESCYAVDNFFTSTIYEKGAEVIRMIQTILGRPGFKKGMDLYFERHDGQAVVIEDFIAAMADANNFNFTHFKKWYSTPGTPLVKITETPSLDGKNMEWTFSQDMNPPLHIPLEIGVIDSQDLKELKIESSLVKKNSEGKNIFHLNESYATIQLKDLRAKPVLSINRQFSAPVNIDFQQSEMDLIFQLSFDSDEFNRLAAVEKIFLEGFLSLYKGESWSPNPELWSSLKKIIKNDSLNGNFRALSISLPAQSLCFQKVTEFDCSQFLKARKTLSQLLTCELQGALFDMYDSLRSIDTPEARSLKNICLGHLRADELIRAQLLSAQNMTDQEWAFSLALGEASTLRQEAIDFFLSRWKTESVVMNKWFSNQAGANHPETFTTVRELWSHPLFDKENPNRLYSLLSRFADNLPHFYQNNAEVFKFFFEKVIEVDSFNPSAATRVASSLETWQKATPVVKALIQKELDLALEKKISPNLFEILSKCNQTTFN